ncbi:hypothetical protein [Streptomyces swartbergensis]|uniref:hypothetical protein n=1 Tax=Streptomyces swartbergensis TaxID=487165 RepID=UPI00381084AA
MYALWSLREDVSLRAARGGDVDVVSDWGVDRLLNPHPLVSRALERMTWGPTRLENVTDDRHGAEHPLLVPVLRQLSHLVVRSLALDDRGGPLLSVVPVSRVVAGGGFCPVRATPQQRVRLTEDVAIWSGANGPLMTSATSRYSVEMHRQEVQAVVRAIDGPQQSGCAVDRLPAPVELTCGILGYFAATGMAALF